MPTLNPGADWTSLGYGPATLNSDKPDVVLAFGTKPDPGFDTVEVLPANTPTDFTTTQEIFAKLRSGSSAATLTVTPIAAAEQTRNNTGWATTGALVVPSDANDMAEEARYLYVGGAGDVKITSPEGDTIIFHAVPAGSYVKCAAARVWSTGTTASNILALR